MKNIFIFSCLLMLFSFVYAQAYYLNLIIYKNDSVELQSFSIHNGSAREFPVSLKNNYEFRIIAKDRSLLFSQPFVVNFIGYPDPLENSSAPGEVLLNKREDTWSLPYYSEAQYIQLFHEDKKIWEYEIPENQQNQGSGTPNFPIEYVIASCVGIVLFVTIVLGAGYWLMKNRGKTK